MQAIVDTPKILARADYCPEWNADKTDGNYLVIFALPTIFHQDERYYALGRGSILHRAFYAASRVAITPDYEGRSS